MLKLSVIPGAFLTTETTLYFERQAAGYLLLDMAPVQFVPILGELLIDEIGRFLVDESGFMLLGE